MPSRGGGRGERCMRNSFFGLILCMVAASTVLVEPPTVSRLGSRYVGGIKYSEEQADEAATDMASCLVTKRQAAARAYIDAYFPDESDKWRDDLCKEVSCMSFVGISGMSDTMQVTFPRDVLRGKFAEALLKGQSS